MARWRFPGRSIKSDRSAARPKIAGWCWKPSPAAIPTTRSSADKSFYYTPQFARDLKDVTVGFAPVDFSEGADPAARADYAKALETIRSLGVQVIEAKLPEFPYGAVIGTIISAEGSADLRAAHQQRQSGPARRPAPDRGSQSGPGDPRQGLSEGHAHPLR